MMPPVLAVDPGEARLGLAISDPTGTIARPLEVLRHSSRAKDVAAILERAARLQAGSVLVGLALDAEGHVGHQARKGMRLAEALRQGSGLAVETWDESDSTQAAKRGPDDPMLDARAAAVFLQEYLDAQRPR